MYPHFAAIPSIQRWFIPHFALTGMIGIVPVIFSITSRLIRPMFTRNSVNNSMFKLPRADDGLSGVTQKSGGHISRLPTEHI